MTSVYPTPIGLEGLFLMWLSWPLTLIPHESSLLVKDNYYIQEGRPEQGGGFPQTSHCAREYLSSPAVIFDDCKPVGFCL